MFNLTVDKQDQFQPQTIGNCLKDVFNSIESTQTTASPTGLDELDKLISGMFRKDLIIIAARASMGETWLACHLANYVVANQKMPVVFPSSEMSKEQLSKRILAMHSGIDSGRLGCF